MAKKIALLGTGGTIAGTAPSAEDKVGYTAAQISIQNLLRGVPGALALPFVVEAEQVAQIDSKDMGFAVWTDLATRVAHHLTQDDVAGVVITHGTDTLEETAFFLHLALPHLLWPRSLLANKPVVLTCAMRPATSKEADGPQNLGDALLLAAYLGAQGVMVVCAGQIHAALHVQKIHTERLNAFDSGDAGVLGSISAGVVKMASAAASSTSDATDASLASFGGSPVRVMSELYGLESRQPESSQSIWHLPAPSDWPRVEIVMNYAGASGHTVDAWVAEALTANRSNASPIPPVRGIVVAGTGNGTVHDDLQAALVRAQTAGIRVVRTTRCAYGQVQAVPGQGLAEISALTPVKARVALILALMTSK